MPNESLYENRPIYRRGVKITDWFEEYLQYPLDFPNSKGAHYKTFGPTDEVFIPQTSAKEAMEQGRQTFQSAVDIRRQIVNFTAYPLIDLDRNFSHLKEYDIPEPEKKVSEKLISQYQRTFTTTMKAIKKKKDCCQDVVLHPLFNRIPKNDFAMASYTSEYKFMDDHFFNPSEAKKCNNFLNQIRKISYNPWLGVYQ